MNCTRLRPRLLRREHLQVLVEAMDRVQAQLPEPQVIDAAERFFQRTFSDVDQLSRYLQDQDAHSQFYPWLLWDADLPLLADTPHACLGAALLPTHAHLRAEVLQALATTPPDVFQVRRTAGRHTTLERVSDGMLVGIEEPALHTVLHPNELLIARVLDLGDEHLLDAVHACLPSGARRGLVRAARKVRTLPMEARLAKLLRAADRAMVRVLNAGPRLAAPDGSPVVRVSTALQVRALDTATAGLRALVAGGELERHGPTMWRVRDPALGPVGASLRLHASAAPRAEGSKPARLMVTTSSLERSERLAEALAARIPGLELRMSVLRDLNVLMNDEERSAFELRHLAHAWIDEYLSGFEDTPQRSLNDLTPRQAMATSRGRSLVRELLRALAKMGDDAGAGVPPRIAQIWASLDG